MPQDFVSSSSLDLVYQKGLTSEAFDLIIIVDMKTIINFIILMLVTIILFLPKANANPVNDFGNKLNNWWANEKSETYYYQKGKQEEGKAQLKKNWNQIKTLLGIKQ